MIICLTGKAGAGKGTVATYLQNRHQFHIVSFAGPIRSMLIAGLGLRPEDFQHGRKEQPLDWLGRSPRQLSQTLGTEWGRELVDKDLWIKLACRKVSWLHDAGFDVVIDDCRFDNEALAMSDMGAILVRVHRPSTIQVAAHISEAGITLPERMLDVIHNDGTVEQLHEQVDKLLHQIMPGAAI